MAELDAQIGLTADASGVEAGVGRAKKSLASLGASATQMGQDVAGAGDKAGKAISSVGDGGEKSAKKIERDTKAMQSSIQRYIATLEAGSKDSRRYWETMADFKGLDKNALRPLLDQLDSVTAKTKETESAANLLGGSFMALRAAASVAIGSVVVQSATQAATALYEASVQAERLRIMLDFSSARGSAREIAYLRTITSELGLAFGSTATAYSQFQAAARGTALEGEKSRAVFESIAKASAVMGLSAEQSGGVLLALQQMISKGTVQAEELRGQLGERLPGAFQIAAKAMGVTTAELGKMLEQGQVVADDFLPKFAKALNESVGSAAEKAANRLDAATNRFNDAWERLKQNVGDSGVSSAMADGFGTAAGSLDALSVSIERARINGSGFFGQLGAAVGTMYELGNTTDRAKVNMYDNAKATAEAQKQLERLQRIAATEGSSAWLLKEIGNLSRYIGELQRAKRERMALDNPEKDPRDQSGFKPRGASYSDYARQQSESEKALIDVRTRAAGINKQYFADLKTYQDALKLGTIDHAQYVKAVSELATETWKSSTAGKDAEKSLKAGASEAKKAASEYQRLVETIKTKIATEEQELAGGEKLTESQRLRVKFAQELQTSLKGLSAAKVAEYTADLDRLDALERESKARKEYLEIAEQERQQRIKIAQAAEQSVANLITGNQQLREEIQLIGLSASEQMEVIRLREEAVLLVQEQHLAEMARAEDVTGTMTRERIALEQEIELRRERLELMGQKVKREAVVASNREIAQEWQRTADQINQTLTDALMRGFESGKDFASNLRDTVVNMFKTMVLRPVISAIVMPVAGAITGALGLAGSASAGQGGAGTLGNIGTIASIGSMFGGSLMAGAGWMTGATSFGGALSAGGSLLGTGFAGTMSGVGMLSGALLPLILGASLLSSFDKSGTPHYGAVAEYEGGKVVGTEQMFYTNAGVAGRYSKEAQPGVNAVAMGAGGILDAASRLAGGKGGFKVRTAYSDDSSDDPGFGSLRIERDGRKIVDWEDTRTSRWAARVFADGEEGARMYAAAVAKDVRDAMLDIDLPEWARKLLTDIGDEVSMEQLSQVVQQIGVIKDTFDALGATLTGFAELTDGARMAILDAAGSIEALAANAGTYYQNFYSDEERTDIAKKKVQERMSELGIDIDLSDPKAREKYRKMVEEQMAKANEEEVNKATIIAGMSTEMSRIEGGMTSGMLADILGPNVAATEEQLGDIAAAFGQLDTASMSVEDLQKAVGDLIAPVLGTGKSASETVAAMLELSGAFAEVTMSAEDVARAEEEAAKRKEEEAKRAQKDAYDTLRRAIDLDRKDLQAQASSIGEAINGISSAVDLLKSNARELYGEVDSTQQMLAAQGMVYIEDALAGVRAGASVADYTGLSDAISAARGGIESGAYKSEFERQRDALVLAGQLSELGELGDMQLSVEERQLRAINEQLEYLDKLAQKADELINGTVALTETVDTYFSRLLELFEKPADSGDGSGGSTSSGRPSFGVGGGGGGSSGGSSKYLRPVYLGTAGVGYQGVTAPEDIERLDKLSDLYHSYDGTGDLDGLLTAIKNAGGSLSDLEALSGLFESDWRRAAESVGIPAFAGGGLHAGGLRLVGERGWEVEATGPARIWNQQQLGQALGGGNSERIERLVTALMEQNARLEARLAAIEGNTKKQADQFESYSNGGTFSRQKVMA